MFASEDDDIRRKKELEKKREYAALL